MALLSLLQHLHTITSYVANFQVIYSKGGLNFIHLPSDGKEAGVCGTDGAHGKRSKAFTVMLSRG